jgi:hypothetical protein
MPPNKSARVHRLKKRKFSPREGPGSSEAQVYGATNFKEGAIEESLRTIEDIPKRSRVSIFAARGHHPFEEDSKTSEAKFETIVPEEDKDDYFVEVDNKATHLFQGHIHSCQHADDCSDDPHSSEEEDTLEQWEHEQDDEEEVAIKNTDDVQDITRAGKNGLLYCDMCGEDKIFDDFSSKQQWDVPPLPHWVQPDWSEIKEGNFRFCLRHSPEEQMKWVRNWRSERT